MSKAKKEDTKKIYIYVSPDFLRSNDFIHPGRFRPFIDQKSFKKRKDQISRLMGRSVFANPRGKFVLVSYDNKGMKDYFTTSEREKQRDFFYLALLDLSSPNFAEDFSYWEKLTRAILLVSHSNAPSAEDNACNGPMCHTLRFKTGELACYPYYLLTSKKDTRFEISNDGLYINTTPKGKEEICSNKHAGIKVDKNLLAGFNEFIFQHDLGQPTNDRRGFLVPPSSALDFLLFYVTIFYQVHEKILNLGVKEKNENTTKAEVASLTGL